MEHPAFSDKGGVLAAREVFEGELDGILDNLSEALAA